MQTDRLFLGVDIGTTTLSFSLIDGHTGDIVESRTLANDSSLSTGNGQSEQDPERMVSLVLSTVSSLLDAHAGVQSIGLTGQMHGVVCLDAAGKAVSPLYTWQDQRADDALCDEILARTGHRVAAGYGHATLYALLRSGQLPSHAAQYCTIMDYTAMRLIGRSSPLMHDSCAASLGLYNMAAGAFDLQAIDELLPHCLRIPETTDQNRIAGHHRGVPVSVALGDNQASFLGSVRDDAHSMLINYGTGSQLSIVCDAPRSDQTGGDLRQGGDLRRGGDLRPYVGGKYLQCFSALCGGRAYALLERFFASYMASAGCAGDSQYETMNALARRAYDAERCLRVSTQFCGTRENPALRGSITGISADNFTPEALILGVLRGMVTELADQFDPASHPQITHLVASGNAVQKNPVLRQLLCDAFSMPVRLCCRREEAAFGAALFGALCAGLLDEQTVKSLIS